MEGIVLQRQSDLPKLLKSWGLPAVDWFAVADGADGAFEKYAIWRKSDLISHTIQTALLLNLMIVLCMQPQE